MLAVVITRIALHELQVAVVKQVQGDGIVPVVRATLAQVLGGLGALTVWLLVAGPSSSWPPTSPGAVRVQGPALAWAGAHRDPLRAGGVIAAVVFLLIAAASLACSIVVLVLLVVWELAVTVVVRPPGDTPAGNAH